MFNTLPGAKLIKLEQVCFCRNSFIIVDFKDNSKGFKHVDTDTIKFSVLITPAAHCLVLGGSRLDQGWSMKRRVLLSIKIL